MSTYATNEEDFHKGFDAGNHDNSYVTTDLDEAREDRNHEEKSRAYRDGYVLGFWSSYETHEVDSDYRDELMKAYRHWCLEAQEWGISVGARDAD